MCRVSTDAYPGTWRERCALFPKTQTISIWIWPQNVQNRVKSAFGRRKKMRATPCFVVGYFPIKKLAQNWALRCWHGWTFAKVFCAFWKKATNLQAADSCRFPQPPTDPGGSFLFSLQNRCFACFLMGRVLCIASSALFSLVSFWAAAATVRHNSPERQITSLPVLKLCSSSNGLTRLLVYPPPNTQATHPGQAIEWGKWIPPLTCHPHLYAAPTNMMPPLTCHPPLICQPLTDMPPPTNMPPPPTYPSRIAQRRWQRSTWPFWKNLFVFWVSNSIATDSVKKRFTNDDVVLTSGHTSRGDGVHPPKHSQGWTSFVFKTHACQVVSLLYWRS